MGFKSILKRTSRSDEKIILMKLGHSHEKDELGYPIQKYIPIQELDGIIQAPQDLDVGFEGEESNPSYIAYLMPEFNLEAKNLDDYRIMFERPYETMLLKIIQYNPNLFLRHKRHHVEIHLILEKKYEL